MLTNKLYSNKYTYKYEYSYVFSFYIASYHPIIKLHKLLLNKFSNIYHFLQPRYYIAL